MSANNSTTTINSSVPPPRPKSPPKKGGPPPRPKTSPAKSKTPEKTVDNKWNAFDDVDGGFSSVFGGGGTTVNNNSSDPFGTSDPFASTTQDTTAAPLTTQSDPFSSNNFSSTALQNTNPVSNNAQPSQNGFSDPFASSFAQPTNNFNAFNSESTAEPSKPEDPWTATENAQPKQNFDTWANEPTTSFTGEEEPFGSESQTRDPFDSKNEDPFADTSKTSFDDPFLSKPDPFTTAGTTCSKPTHKAIFPFEARSKDELTFKPDDQLVVVPPGAEEDVDQGWLKGFVLSDPSKIGVFPGNYVQEIPTNSIGSEKSAFSRAENSPQPGQGTIYDPPKTMLVKHNFKAQKSTQLSLEVGKKVVVAEQHKDWYYGWPLYHSLDMSEGSNKKAWFPVEFVEEVNEPEINLSKKKKDKKRSESPVKRRAPKPPNESKVEMKTFVAQYAYYGNDSDLSFEKGQVILVEKPEGECQFFLKKGLVLVI